MHPKPDEGTPLSGGAPLYRALEGVPQGRWKERRYLYVDSVY